MNVPATLAKAIELHQEGQLRSAAGHYQAILQEQPLHVNALHLLGVVAHQVGEDTKSIELISRAIALRNDKAPFHSNLGNAFFAVGRTSSAIECYERALEIKPDFQDALVNLGNAYLKKHRPFEAYLTYARARDIDPANFEACHGMGVACFRTMRLDEASSLLDEALRLRPQSPQCLYSLALVFEMKGDFDTSERYLRQTISDAINTEQNPQSIAQCRAALAMLLLRQGRFREGFSEYEYRLQCPEIKGSPDLYPRWDGCNFDGTLAIFAEQGLGDNIQFIRFVTHVHERVTRVIVVAPPALRSLFRNVDGVDELVDAEQTSNLQCDAAIPMMSLPFVLGIESECECSAEPYLTANPQFAEYWATRLPTNCLTVGIAWQGSRDLNTDVWRSFPLSALAPLADDPGTRLISLQKGEGVDQLGDIEADILEFVDLDTQHGPFMDTAAIMSHLDVVVTCDSSIAHLAGAMGVRTWILLPHVADWRWQVECEDTFWYPRTRLFRRKMSEDWTDVVLRVRHEMKLLQEEFSQFSRKPFEQ